MWPHLANCSVHSDGMSKIQPPKARNMEGRTTQAAVWSCTVEEAFNIPTVHKESCRFNAKDPLAKAVPGTQLGVKESIWE